MFKKILTLLIAVFLYNSAFAENNRLDDIFANYNGEYVSGFTKPLFTTLHQGLNSNFFTNNVFKKDEWRIGLDIALNGMSVPNSQRSFNVTLPTEWANSKIAYLDENGVTQYKQIRTIEQPTIYGGKSTPVFSTDSLNNGSNVNTYLEGLNINNISVLPNIQLIIGLPTQTEIRLRGGAFGDATYYGVVINQRFDEIFELFGNDNKKHSLGFNFAYQGANFKYQKSAYINDNTPQKKILSSLDLNSDLSTFAVGFNYNYQIMKNFVVYSGIQYEGISGKVETDFVDFADSQNPKYNNIVTDISSYNSYRALVGLSYKVSFAEFHVDGIYASQPMFTAGVSFWFGSWGGAEDLEVEETKPTN